MLSKQEIIEEVLDLPIEDRAYIIDTLIRSMNPVNTEIDRKWIEVSKKRLDELISGKVQGIPGDEVFDRVGNDLKNEIHFSSRRRIRV